MRNPGYRVVVISFLILVSSSASICQNSIPRNWRKVNADGLFTFYLPPRMNKTDMTGVESFLGEYLDYKRRFLFIHEPYDYLAYDSRRSDEMRDYRETKTKIGARKATIRTYHTTERNAYYSTEAGETTYVAELHVGDWAKGEVELFMSLESKNSSDLKVAKRIFNSVHLPKMKTRRTSRWTRAAGAWFSISRSQSSILLPRFGLR